MSDVKVAPLEALFYGEEWYRCPHCGFPFEYFDAVFERYGIKKTDEDYVYLCKCGERFRV